MKNDCYSIFETLPNWYPLVDRAASLHILSIESASLFAAKLKGGCAIGEALAVEGEVREKPAPSGSMGKKKGRRDKQRNGLHSHAHPSLSPSWFKLVNNGTAEILCLYFPRHNRRVVWELVLGRSSRRWPEKRNLGQRYSLPKTWAWRAGYLEVAKRLVTSRGLWLEQRFSVHRDFGTNVWPHNLRSGFHMSLPKGRQNDLQLNRQLQDTFQLDPDAEDTTQGSSSLTHTQT